MQSKVPKSWKIDVTEEKSVNIDGFDELVNKIYKPLRNGLGALTQEEKDEYLHLLDTKNAMEIKEHAIVVYNIYTQVCNSIIKENTKTVEIPQQDR